METLTATTRGLITLENLANVNPTAAKRINNRVDSLIFSYEVGDKIHFVNGQDKVLAMPVNGSNENFSIGLPCYVERDNKLIPHFFSFSSLSKTSLKEYNGVKKVSFKPTELLTDNQKAAFLSGNCLEIVKKHIILIPANFVEDGTKPDGSKKFKAEGEKEGNAFEFVFQNKSSLKDTELQKLLTLLA